MAELLERGAALALLSLVLLLSSTWADMNIMLNGEVLAPLDLDGTNARWR